MRRPGRLLAILLAALLFVAISAALARFLSTENNERDAELALLQAQARGDVRRLIAQLTGCQGDRGCVATARANVGRLQRAGAVKILALSSPTAYALTSASGRTRVAWTVVGRLPVVQCVLVHRSGNALTGMSVSLLRLSAPISNQGLC